MGSQPNRAVAVGSLLPLALIRACLLAACVVAASLATAATAPGARATPNAKPLSGFAYNSWNPQDGAPGDVWALALAPDGTLWLGSGQGLVRFDGVRFERYRTRQGARLPALNINALAVMPRGEIWLGDHDGGAVRLRDGVATRYGVADGLPSGSILRFASASGALWAATATGLARFDDQRWSRIGSDWGFPRTATYYAFADRGGVLWASTAEGLYYLLPGEHRFHDPGVRVAPYAIVAQDRSGRLWLSDGMCGTRPLPELLKGVAPVPCASHGSVQHRAWQMLFASDGSLWLTELGRGVARVPHPERVAVGQSVDTSTELELFTHEDGLASAVTVPLLQGADGEVWVGTNLGLSSFRRRRLQEVPGLASSPLSGFAVVREGSGVLVSNQEQVLEVDPPRPPVAVLPSTLFFDPRAAVRSGDGALWYVERDLLWRIRDGKRSRWQLPAKGLWTNGVDAMAPDDKDGVWLSVHDNGVFHARPGALTRESRLQPEDGWPSAIMTGDDGDVWFGFDGELLRLAADGKRSRHGEPDGLAVGRVTAMLMSRYGLVVAGQDGVALLRDGHFVTVAALRDDVFGYVSGIVESDSGDLWLNGGRGVVQISASDVLRVFTQGAPLNYRLLDAQDGLPGIALQDRASPTALRDARGRLWFAANQGVAWLDPSEASRSARHPPVEINEVRAGDESFEPVPGLTLPKGVRTVTLRYGALTLDRATKIRFRCRLDEVDEDWREVGNQREVNYANLAPGTYHFSVRAANADGLWNNSGTSIAFSIPPTLVQTRAFFWTCVVLLCVLALLVHRLRMRVLSNRLQLRLEERHAERERIARDLHDTLLQGFQGLVLTFHLCAIRLEEGELRRQLAQALDSAEAALVEGRERVHLLRRVAGRGESIAVLLGELGREIIKPPTEFRIVVTGEERALCEAVVDELQLIAREALANAQRHARARLVEIRLDFALDALRLSIRDDGTGMESLVRERMGRDGRLGLRGMSERAGQLGGTLNIHPWAGCGTEVSLHVPAAAAYSRPAAEQSPSGWRRWWRRWLG